MTSRSDAERTLYIALWILILYICPVYSSTCITSQIDETTRRRTATCKIQPKPPPIRDSPPRCPGKNTCFAKGLHGRHPQRMGLETPPELLQYPKTPDFTQDTRFCLVFTPPIWNVTEPVKYTVRLGEYRCTLNILRRSGLPDTDVEATQGGSEGVRDFAARFGLQLQGRHRKVQISTTYGRLKHKSWDFTVSASKQTFQPDIAARMAKCLEALKIEGTDKWPGEVTTTTDRCLLQQFHLSYPTQCTSLSFRGGWKRGQTVTSATWTVASLPRLRAGRCVDVGSAPVYAVVSEFTDRYISIEERQLRHGLNRICNEFLFSTVFGAEGNTRTYGPYNFKICGYTMVKTNPCIILKPVTESSEHTRLPVGDSITFDARETIEKGQVASDYRFKWSCEETNTSQPCAANAIDNKPMFKVEADKPMLDKKLKVTVVVIFKPGTDEEASAHQYRLLSIIPSTDLLINIRCLSNCHTQSVSVLPVVLDAECLDCEDFVGLEYDWSMTDVTDPANKTVVEGEELKKLVENAELHKEVFSTTRAGNVLLERRFKICVNVTKEKASGKACKTLDYSGAPLPFPGDLCIITPYNAELPGFLVWSYSGLCTWRGNDEALRYKIFTYDVGVPEHDRHYELVAFSDISRMPSLELPFGNPDYDYELGVVFHISNDIGQTYVFDVKEAFKKIGVVFKVRRPVDYGYLHKVEEITDKLMDPKKSGRFGSRQGIINVAGLVANIVDEDTKRGGQGLDKDKRVKIRESLLSSVVPLSNSEINTVLQLTPIIDTLTKYDDELTDEVEDKGTTVLEHLTEGLNAIAATDVKTANHLSRTHYEVLERFSARSVTHQIRAIDANVTDHKETKKFVERASSYSKMFINIGSSMVSSTLHPDNPRLEVKNKSAIAVNWSKVKNNSVLSVGKSRTDNSTFGSSVTIDSSSLNVSAGTEVNIIMAVTEHNLFMFGNGSHDVNMPMISVELHDRETKESVGPPSLAKPADIFVERTPSAEEESKWLWERINISRAEGHDVTGLEPSGSGSGVRYTLLKQKAVPLNVSATHPQLLRFNMPHDVTIRVSVDLLFANGSRQKVIEDTAYPRTGKLPTYMNVTQKPDVLYLPTVGVNDTKGRYELVIKPTSSIQYFNKSDVPYVMMLAARISCRSWNATSSSWEGQHCKATDISSFEVLHCQCTHLSIFSGGVLVPPNPVNVLEVELFLEFFNNPAIVSVVVFIWLLYFLLIYWARGEDWLDTFRSRVAVLEDNDITDECAYLVCCVTGWWINSGTSAMVFMYIKGSKGMSRVHRLTDEEQQLFTKGAENWFILTTPSSLGRVRSVVVWHDASGPKPAWFLKEVYVQNIYTGNCWHCLYNDWISVEHGTGDLCVEIPAMTPEEVHRRRLYQMVLKTSLSLRTSHLWLSIVLKPCYSPFTRVQRLTCALCLLMTTMLASLMFYGIPSTDPAHQISTGPLRLNFRSLIIGIECAVVVFPINLILVQLFSRTSRRPTDHKYQSFAVNESGLPAADHSLTGSSESEMAHSGDTSELDNEAHHKAEAGEYGSHPYVDYYQEESSEEEESSDEEGDSSGSTSGVTESTTSEAAVSQDVTSHKDSNVSAHTEDADKPEKATGVTSHDVFRRDSDIKTPQEISSQSNPCFSSSSSEPPMTDTEPGTDPGTQKKQIFTAADANNSAKRSTPTCRDPRPIRQYEVNLRPRRRMTERFSFITETPWFQNAVILLRQNVARMVAERKQYRLDPKQQSPNPVTDYRQLQTPAEEAGFRKRSYFDTLKEKVKTRVQPPCCNKELAAVDLSRVGCGDSPQRGGGDQTRSPIYDSYNKVSYFDKLKDRRQSYANRTPERELKRNRSSDYLEEKRDSPSPQPCWFCSTVPGQKHSLQHLKVIRGNKAVKESSSHDDVKGKFKTTVNKLRRKSKKKEGQAKVSDDDKQIPFDTIRRFHDYEYQQALKKGAKALKIFKRQAAQCIAEDFVNVNRNASSESAGDEVDAQEELTNTSSTAADTDVAIDIDDSDESSEEAAGVCCKLCTDCMGCAKATLVCIFQRQCPKCFRTPWWSLYLTWVLAITVALASSWVVMLYGLRLGYQGSVDWLSSFFTGWFQSVVVMQPVKAMVISMFYVIVFKQHVNVREESGVAVYDENDEPLHMQVLKEYEARRKLLDGMWAPTDYEYPIPRSKAKDIKLRLEQDARARLILRESALWALLLAFVTVAALGHTRVEDAYATNTVLRDILENAPFGDISFQDVEEGGVEDLWQYMTTTLIPSLYTDTNNTVANNVSLVIGSTRIRQIRQEADLCKSLLRTRFARAVIPDRCRPPFSFFYEETDSFNMSWHSRVRKEVVEGGDGISQAWVYRTAIELQEGPIWGRRTVYPGGGFDLSLPNNRDEAIEVLEELKQANWMDQDTRAVVMRVNVYTPSKDLLTLVTLLAEFSTEGPMHLSLDLFTTKLNFYAGDQESFVAVFETGWMAMTALSMVLEMQEVIRLGAKDYLSCPWTYLELLNFLLSMAAVALHLARVVLVDHFLDRVAEFHHNSYVSFAVHAFLDQVVLWKKKGIPALQLLKASIFVLVVLKVFKVLRFNRYFHILLQSFYIARYSIINQTIIAFVIFMAFALSSFVLFSSKLEDYRSFSSCALALVNFGLGEGDFYGFQESQAVLGPLIYFLFIIFFYILTISFFVTFVLESFNVSRVFVQLNAEEEHVLRYVKRVYRLLVGATPKIKQVRRQRRTHPFKAASFSPHHP